MAMAEEYSRKADPVHRVVDLVQDSIARSSGIVIEAGELLRPDIGPGNMNVNTAKEVRDYILSHYDKQKFEKNLPENISLELAKNEVSISYASAEMVRLIHKMIGLKFSEMENYDKAQVLVDTWREGPKRITRMLANSKNNSNYKPVHQHNKAKHNYENITRILRECKKS